MRTYVDCIPCLFRQALSSLRLASDEEQVHEQVMREVLSLLCKMDFQQSPPAMAQRIHRLIRQLTNTYDPYRRIKDRFTTFALALYPKLERLMAESERPLETAVRLALAGNIIDLGAKCSLKMSEIEETIHEALATELDMASLEDFEKETAAAKTILYIGDNAGEVVFDRFLIEQLGPERITFVVKARPVINDATIEDAKAAGLPDLVKVIDNGDDAPGTILKTCPIPFRCYFTVVDVVIAKGQGNYETLSDVNRNIFFILMAKCPVIARDLDCEVGEMILRRSEAFREDEVNAKI